MPDLPGARHGRSARAIVRRKERNTRRATGARTFAGPAHIVANGVPLDEHPTDTTQEDSDGDRL